MRSKIRFSAGLPGSSNSQRASSEHAARPVSRVSPTDPVWKKKVCRAIRQQFPLVSLTSAPQARGKEVRRVRTAEVANTYATRDHVRHSGERHGRHWLWTAIFPYLVGQLSDRSADLHPPDWIRR